MGQKQSCPETLKITNNITKLMDLVTLKKIINNLMWLKDVNHKDIKTFMKEWLNGYMVNWESVDTDDLNLPDKLVIKDAISYGMCKSKTCHNIKNIEVVIMIVGEKKIAYVIQDKLYYYLELDELEFLKADKADKKFKCIKVKKTNWSDLD